MNPGSILFFIETGGPGGAEQVVLQLARAQRERGRKVAVATLRIGWLTEQLAKESLEHIQLESSGSLDLRLIRSLARVLRGYDLLHTHLFDSALYGALASKVARRPQLATEHGDIHHIDTRRFFALKLGVLRIAGTRFSAVSEFSKQALVRKGIPAERVTVIGNPLRAEQFLRKCPHSERTQLREALGLKSAEEAVVWIHVANHRPVKDQATLLRGFSLSLSQSAVPQHLLLVGDGPERPALERLTDELGIRESTHFLGFRDDVRELLALADGCILSSRSEALPMSLLEAAAAGLALISSDVGGIRDIIEPEQSGLLFAQGDAEQLAAQLRRLAEDASLLRKLQTNAQAHVEREYALDVVLARYEQIYGDIRS